MTELPKFKVDEILLEGDLTTKKHLIVEGPTDDRVFRVWARELPDATHVVVNNIESLEIPSGVALQMGLNEGNRSYVMYVALRASELSVDVRCIVDYDCGQYLDDHDYPALLRTDFPSIESYALEEDTLHRANLLHFNEELPAAKALISDLSFALRELYAVRLKNVHLPAPKYSAGLDRKKPSLAEFDVAATVNPALRASVKQYPRPNASDDPRSYAYGHDIAELLLAAFGNKLKNIAGLKHRDAVEGALVNSMLAVGSYKSERLFQELAAWIAE